MTADEAIAYVKRDIVERERSGVKMATHAAAILVAEIERLRMENQHLHDLIGGRS